MASRKLSGNLSRYALLLLCTTVIANVACDEKAGDDTKEAADSKKKKKEKKKKKKENKVLDKLKNFKGSETGKEAYDNRVLGNKAYAAKIDSPIAQPLPVPPTLTDVLIEDMRMIAETDLGMGKIEVPFTQDQLDKLVKFYVDTDKRKIRGYRPMTNKEFITGLSEDERKSLIGELIEHMKGGFAEPVLVPKHESDA